MVRSRLVAVIVVLAFGALLIGAGPAAAAQGGNDDTAHACQHGGWASLTDPATRQPFTNQGACVSSGAHGNPPLSASLVASDELGCGGTCWGRIIGTGLQPGAPFTWGASGPTVGLEFLGPIGSDGRVDVAATLPCGQGWGNLQASSTTAAGTPISSNVANSPCG
jgi:hypothetical protein